jgi:hypothetical protein
MSANNFNKTSIEVARGLASYAFMEHEWAVS